MTDQEFLELKAEVERLEALHKASRDDHNGVRLEKGKYPTPRLFINQ